jgi:hypothetical protein
MRPRVDVLGCICGGVILAFMSLSWARTLGENVTNADQPQCASPRLLLAEAKGAAAPLVGSGATSGELRQRVERRPMPGMLPAQGRQEFEQATVEGSRIRAKPGYTIHVLPNGEGVLARKKNDAPGTGIKCLCMGQVASGQCKLVIRSSSSADCVSDGCKKGYCGVRLGPPSKSLMQ